MRKITDLKDREYIAIINKKEAKEIGKLIGWTTGFKGLVGGFISKGLVENTFCFNEEIISGIELPASDFLPKRKSNRKRIKELEARIGQLEAKGITVTEAQVVEKGEGIYDIQGTYGVDKIGISMQFNEDLNIFYKAIITQYETFKEQTKLETGKWYKDSYSKVMLLYDHCNGVSDVGYGFDTEGEWMEIGEVDFDGLIPATEEEVKERLIAEAERRYPIGTKVLDAKYLDLKSDKIVKSIEFDDINTIGNGSLSYLFYYGKWATIIEQQKEIDWSVPGQLITSGLGNIWITSGMHYHSTFEGICLVDRAGNKINKYINDIQKEGANLYTEPITLCNP